jgi:hypothetical protein
LCGGWPWNIAFQGLFYGLRPQAACVACVACVQMPPRLEHAGSLFCHSNTPRARGVLRKLGSLTASNKANEAIAY